MNKAELDRAFKAAGSALALKQVVVGFGDQLVQIKSVVKLGDRLVIQVEEEPMDESPEPLY